MKTKEKYEKCLAAVKLKECAIGHRLRTVMEKIRDTQHWLTSFENMQSERIYSSLVDLPVIKILWGRKKEVSHEYSVLLLFIKM